MKTLLIVSLCIFSAYLSHAQTTLYVDQSIQPANSTADGSSAYPFSTLAAAFAKVQATTTIIFKGSSYKVTAVEAYSTNVKATNYVITIKAEQFFTLKFEQAGRITCKNYPQSLIETAVKNVNITIQGMNIETTSSATSLFFGDCFFTLQDIYINTINTTLLSLGDEGSCTNKNITIADMQLSANSSLYDQDSRERLEADYLTFESIYFINKKVNVNEDDSDDVEVYTMIRSFLQYRRVEIRNSYLEGVGFSIKGEQIGGNNKTNITVSNVTMKNAENFFFIESYGFIVMENSLFENASDRAMHFFLTDENLSPDQIVMNNCTFIDNNADLEGAAIAFQGSKETSGQFYLNLYLTNSIFLNNNAKLSGGALAFLLLKNGNIQVNTSQFIGNSAVEGGGALHVDKGESTMAFDIRLNNFDSNSAFTGGVFNFEFMTQVKVILTSNNYTNNLATFEGGIGFISESDIILKDTSSNGTGNLANFEGGAWSIKGQSQNITFQNIIFKDTLAKFRGGCVFNSAAILYLNSVTFNNCSTNESDSSGGALFISEDAIVAGSSITFKNNQAEYGASIDFQSTNTTKNHTFTDTTFQFDLDTPDIDRTIKSQVRSDNTGLVFNNVVIPSLKTPFLAHSEGTIVLNNVNVANLKCQIEDSLVTFCLFNLDNDGTGEIDFYLTGLTLTTASSIIPLIVAVDSNLVLSTIKMTAVTSTSGTSIGSFDSCQVKITGLELSNNDGNFIEALSSTILNISNGTFSNEARRNNLQYNATQFIVASQSSVHIDYTTFTYNSAVNPTNGGAMQLSYPPILTLTNVNFTENKASNGGALYIQGLGAGSTINKCTFSKNTAPNDDDSSPGFGGAIYITSSDAEAVSSLRLLQDSSSFIIQDSTFGDNSAYTGGAIYTRETNFQVLGDTFDSNQARSGGALAIDITDAALTIQILDSIFNNNAATLYGSSILQLREDVISDRTGSTFNDQEAQFSGGAPARIKLRAFSYKEGVQYIDDSERNITELLNSGQIALEYDSFYDASRLQLENITSGGSLNKLIEISIHDASGTNLTELSGANNTVSLSIVNPVYPAASLRNESSLANVTSKNLVNGSVTFLKEINIFAFPTSFLPVQVSVSILHKDLGNLQYKLGKESDRFNIQLMNCSIGEIFRKETLICDPCKPDYFSLTDPFTTSVCQKCDINKANCPGGSQIYPLPGYWRKEWNSDNVVECPNPDSCLGGEVTLADNETAYSLTGFCDDTNGYEGNACSRCKPGYGKFGGDDQCTNCENDPGYYVKLIALLAIQIAMIIFNVYSNLGLINEKDKTKEKLTIFQSTIIKVVVDYAQVLGIVASIQITWPIGLGSFGSIVSKSVPSSKDAFSIDCFFSLAQGSNDNLFFYKILILNIQPFLYFFFGTVFWVFLTKIRGQSLQRNSQFKDNILVTNCLIAYVLQPEIVKTTLQLFKCLNLGPTDDPENYLERDMQVQCGSSVHLAWALSIGVPALILWLVFPIVLFLRVMVKISKYNDAATLDKYHFAFKRYKIDKIYWDLYIIVRKAALIFFLVFLNDLYSQIFFSFAVFIFSLHLHYKKEPYEDNFTLEKYGKNTVSLNNLETLGLMSNCFLLFGGLFFIEEENFGVMHGFLMAIALLVNLVFLFRVLKAFWWVFRIKAKIFLDSKKKPPKQAYAAANTKEKQIELPFVDDDDKNVKEISMKKSEGKEDLQEELHEESINLFGQDQEQEQEQEQEHNYSHEEYQVPKERPTRHIV